MGKLTIALLFGGKSTEYEVSCCSAYSILKNIDYNKINVHKIGITKDGLWGLYTGDEEKIRDLSWISDKENLYRCTFMPKTHEEIKSRLLKLNKDNSAEYIDIDIIFPIIHGANGEDGSIQGLASLLEIPCCGADIYGSIYCYDKLMTKTITDTQNIPRANYYAIYRDTYNDNTLGEIEHNIAYPVFIKPSRAGSSIGITKAKNRAELITAIDTAFLHGDTALAEEYIQGKEVEIAVMGNSEDNLYISVCGEIEPGAEFYDYNTKYVNDTAKYFIPARISDTSAAQIRDLAKRIYTSTGCSGFARIDFFVRDNGEVIFNEINTIPGFTPVSMFARLFVHSGISYPECIDIIIKNAR